MMNVRRLAICLLSVVLLASFSLAQQLTGTLSGTVCGFRRCRGSERQSHNEERGLWRRPYHGVQRFGILLHHRRPARHLHRVDRGTAGFKTWEQAEIVFSQGDSRTLSNIKLQVGQCLRDRRNQGWRGRRHPRQRRSQHDAERRLIQDIPIVGRDAGELLKVMPGMALTNGLTQGSGFNDKVVGTNNGPVGAYSSNGTQPNGAMAFMLDGANLVDPGNAGTQIANINQDMVSEVKVLMSSYSAEYAKGPVIFQAFSKSGGNQFHGEGYLYARNSALNSVDAYAHSQGLPNPDEHFYYMGGNIGGPILIPGPTSTRVARSCSSGPATNT